MLKRILPAIFCLTGSLRAAEVDAWPQFRGPQASGVAQAVALPVEWDVKSGKNIRWQTPIPGLAHAAPIVWDDRAYVVTAVYPGQKEPKLGLYGEIEPVDEKAAVQWRLLALNKATGEVTWNVAGHEAVPRVKRHPKATHANSTPATDGDHIVAIFGSEGLFCFDREGKLLWKRDLGPMDSAISGGTLFFRSQTKLIAIGQ